MIDSSVTVHVDFDDHTGDVTVRPGPDGRVHLTLACDGTQSVRLYGDPGKVRGLLVAGLIAFDKHEWRPA
jgi:hypothetical protein